jgi:hypothetical protein
VLIRIVRFFTASLIAGLACVTRVSGAAEVAPRALIVLIGKAGESDELGSVLSELLERDGVTAEFERRARFRASALLSESKSDDRVWVFVTEPDAHSAKLYFRGSFGNRFLLRQLTLKHGLDELGRELIAQVVETSTEALLRSGAGVSREEAKAGLRADADDTDELDEDERNGANVASATHADRASKPTSTPRNSDLEFELGARGVAKWSGSKLGLDHGPGLETALVFRPKNGLFIRGRVVFEYGLGQSLDANGLDADIRTTSLRGGMDVGTSKGMNAVSVGAFVGADFTRTLPKATPSASLDLASKSSAIVPMMRLEARYELTLGAFRAAAGLFGDVSLRDTHYDAQLANGTHRVATPWPVRPGAALTLEFRTRL